MRKIKYKKENVRKRPISPTPASINVDGIVVGECTNNSKLIIINNPSQEIKYVEGVLIIREAGKLKAQSHAWCKMEDLYFDSTAELLELSIPKAKNLDKYYFPYNELHLDEIPEPKGITIPFSDYSNDFLVFCNNNYPIE